MRRTPAAWVMALSGMLGCQAGADGAGDATPPAAGEALTAGVALAVAPSLEQWSSCRAVDQSPSGRACVDDIATEGSRCPTVASVRLTLGHTPIEVRWNGCGPVEPQWGTDGEIVNPESYLLIGAQGADPVVAITNREEPGLSWMSGVVPVDPDGDGIGVIDLIMKYSGTGGMVDHCVLDLIDTDTLGCWAWPPEELEAGANALLEPDETFTRGFYPVDAPDGSLFAGSDTVRLWRPIAAQTDPNCCPSRGTLRAVLRARSGGLDLVSITREAPSS